MSGPNDKSFEIYSGKPKIIKLNCFATPSKKTNKKQKTKQKKE